MGSWKPDRIGDTYYPEGSLGCFLDYVNEEKTSRQRLIVGVLEKMLELGETKPLMLNEGPTLGRGGLKFRKADKNTRLQQKIERMQTEINRELSRYQYVPRVGLLGHLIVTWHKKTEREEQQTKMNEGFALELILNLVRARYLDRLRHCGLCNRWLYAKFRHQHFCSLKCQQKNYTQTDEFKRKRAAYMRKYYLGERAF